MSRHFQSIVKSAVSEIESEKSKLINIIKDEIKFSSNDEKYFSLNGLLYPKKEVKELLKTFKKGHEIGAVQLDSNLIFTWDTGKMTFKEYVSSEMLIARLQKRIIELERQLLEFKGIQ